MQTSTLEIGRLGSLRLETTEHLVQGAFRERTVSVDAARSIEEALAAPLGFPPLAKALVPGDRVAIVVGDAIPQLEDVVRGRSALQKSGVETMSIDIVVANGDDERALAPICGEAQLVIHDPTDESQLCFVGVTPKGEEVRINRRIFDADFVLPLTCARLRGVQDARGVFQGLFPRFAGQEVIRRFREIGSWVSPAKRAALERETAEAGWLIGAPLVVEIVPERDNQVMTVLAGDPSKVTIAAERLCAEVWTEIYPDRADLVVSVVGGEHRDQSWDNIARALAAAQVVAEDGAVAICCDVRQQVGKSLSRLINADDHRAVSRKLERDTNPDSWCAWELVHALERGPVYLFSGIAAEAVEDLGMAPIMGLSELSRLIRRYPSCIVLQDAQHVVATVADGMGKPA